MLECLAPKSSKALSNLSSKLNAEPVLRTYLLSLVSAGIIRDKESMNLFFAKTFWAQQFRDMDKLERNYTRENL